MAFSKFGRARIAREMPPRIPSAYSIKWRRRCLKVLENLCLHLPRSMYLPTALTRE